MTTDERTVFDAQAAEETLRQACALVDLDADDLELMRLGDHAVFRLQGVGLVARVGRGPERLSSVRQEVAVARWLASEGFPAAQLATEAEQPIVLDGRPVTFWESAGDGRTYATTGEMGELLRRLHCLHPPAFPLPELRPFAKVAERLELATLAPATRAFLIELTSSLESEYAELAFQLDRGPLHGDYNVGNVLRDAHGQPQVIDLDTFAVGPREWDLMQTAMYYDSFGWHTEQEYADFVDGYGFDVRNWAGYPTLRTVRELLMVSWLSQNAGADPRAAAEVEKRVASLRSGGSRRNWAPF